MKNIICEHCQKVLTLSDWQQDFYLKSKLKGMTFMMLECNNCGRHTSYDPTNEQAPEIVKSVQHPCPELECDGWVVEVDDFWGCGECGNIWKDENEIG